MVKDLSNCDLSFAILEKRNFQGADLKKINLFEAYLIGAN